MKIPGLSTKSDSLTLDQLMERVAMLRQTAAGESITAETALQSPTVYAIVNRLSSMFAQLPFAVVQDESDGDRMRITEQREHPVTRLINARPNTYQTPYQFKAHIMSSLLLHGFYCAVIGRAGGVPQTLTPLDSGTVTVRMDPSGKLRFATNFGGAAQEFDQSKILYIAGPVSLDGITARSAIESCREAIALEVAAEKFGASLFGSGAVPSLILTRRGAFMDDGGRERFKESWTNLFRKRRGTAVLEGDEWDVKQVQMTNEDSQFLDTRKLQRSIIAGMFNVPPHMVGDLERATFSNISSQALEVLMYTLAPWLECIEASFNRDLLSRSEIDSKRMFSRFDTKRLLRGDLKTTAEFLGMLRQWGFINANEGRGMLDMNARSDEGGDEYLTPMNMAPDDGNGEDKTPPEDDASIDPENPDSEENDAGGGLRAVR